MQPPPLLNFDQIHPDTHALEVFEYGLVLITDNQTTDSFIVSPQYPPVYVPPADLLYMRDFYANNRRFTAAENELLQSLMVPIDATEAEDGYQRYLAWYRDIETYVGPVATKPTLKSFQNPLFWSPCPVEVVLHTGEVLPCCQIGQRAPCVGRDAKVERYLLSAVAEIRPSPFALPGSIKERAQQESVEIHMGDGFYVAEAGGRYYAVDTYRDIFFKKGVVAGSQLQPTPVGTTSLETIYQAEFSEPISVVAVDGLW